MHKIIQLVDSLDETNFGIWNAAISSLNGVEDISVTIVELSLFPRNPRPSSLQLIYAMYPGVSCFSKGAVSFFTWLRKAGRKKKVVIVSNGCWQFPTIAGFICAMLGYKWIAVPQGMLDSWAMQQKAWKKRLYFNLIEKRMLQKANCIRAVSLPEKQQLEVYFHKVAYIPNAVPVQPPAITQHISDKIQVLFLARLHAKKRVVELLTGWSKSDLACNDQYSLIIAGPDHGEAGQLHSIIEQQKLSNVLLTGPVYGEKKAQHLAGATFYFLPSLSEGLPTSLLEALSYGLICFITPACNLPEAFENNVAFKLDNNLGNLVTALNSLPSFTRQDIEKHQKKATDFIRDHFSEEKISIKNRELLLQEQPHHA